MLPQENLVWITEQVYNGIFRLPGSTKVCRLCSCSELSQIRAVFRSKQRFAVVQLSRENVDSLI